MSLSWNEMLMDLLTLLQGEVECDQNIDFGACGGYRYAHNGSSRLVGQCVCDTKKEGAFEIILFDYASLHVL